MFVAATASPEPRLQYHGLADSIPLFARDVHALRSGATATIDSAAPGYPIASLAALPAGDYYVQALANVYTRFPRADGHIVWAHDDRGEGQQFNRAPGNLASDVVRVHLDPRRARNLHLTLTHVLPPLPPLVDTALVKHVRIQSALLSRFWGAPMYLGATVLLPKDYERSGDRQYPVVFEQGHFTRAAPFGFAEDAQAESVQAKERRLARTNRESRYDFSQSWMNGAAPALIAVNFAHPTPYYDDSYAVNSANNGPYGDAIMTELIPHLEAHFRMIAAGRARFLIGGSTGGWEALALQIYHPSEFNGAWGLFPDPVDFHRFQIGNLYTDSSAFATQRNGWIHTEIPAQRDADGNTVATMREESRLEETLGSHGRSGEQFNAWDAAYGPAGDDGYPREIWDKRTGRIDRAVVTYMREHGYDLEAYLEKSWSAIGPQLAGKLHVDVGDDDDYFLNLACYRLQKFLDAQTSPPANATFTYGRPVKSHGWQAKTTIEYLRDMAARAGP
ncbi:MAG: alpha/beta hydrolase-fold protein [Candidatus Velthaea sp.]